MINASCSSASSLGSAWTESSSSPSMEVDIGDVNTPTSEPLTRTLLLSETEKSVGLLHSDESRVQSSIRNSVLNLSNTILGAGVLVLPFAVAKAGLFMGVIMLFVCGALASFGLHLLCFVAREEPGSDFASLSARTVPRASKLVDVAVAVKCFGVATSYMVVTGDLMPEVMHYFTNHDTNGRSALKSRQLWITVFSLLFIVPTVRWRHLDNLKLVSSLCLCFFALVVATILVYRFSDAERFDGCREVDDDRNCPATIKYWPSNARSFLGVVPIFIFGFGCHQNAFNITNELRCNSRKRLSAVVMSAIGVCVLVYASVSVAGYTTFGNLKKYPQDVLAEYPMHGAGAWLPTAVRMLLSMNLSLSYALQCNPCRNSISNLIWRKRAIALDQKQFYLLTYGIVLMSWIVAMSVTSLGTVLAVVGATGSTTISYVLPGLFYYYSNRGRDDPLKYAAFALMCFGICVVPFALTMVLMSDETIG